MITSGGSGTPRSPTEAEVHDEDNDAPATHQHSLPDLVLRQRNSADAPDQQLQGLAPVFAELFPSTRPLLHCSTSVGVAKARSTRTNEGREQRTRLSRLGVEAHVKAGLLALGRWGIGPVAMAGSAAEALVRPVNSS